MPHIIIKLWPGKSEQTKQRLADVITSNVAAVTGYGEDSVSVGIEEVSSGDWESEVFIPDIRKKSNTLYKKPGYTM